MGFLKLFFAPPREKPHLLSDNRVDICKVQGHTVFSDSSASRSKISKTVKEFSARITKSILRGFLAICTCYATQSFYSINNTQKLHWSQFNGRKP